MKSNEALRNIMEKTNTKVSDIAFRLNKKSNVISERLTQENMSVEKLNEMLRIMNYKIAVVPREFRVSEGGYEIE